MLLTAEQILSTKLKTKTIDIPRLGGKVKVQELTGGQRAELDTVGANAGTAAKAYKAVKTWIVLMSLVDDEGNRLFSDGQYDAVSRLPSQVQDAVNDEVDILSGLKEEDIKKTAKKSQGDQDGTSSGSSQKVSAIPTRAS